MPDSDVKLMRDAARNAVAQRKHGDEKSAKEMGGVIERTAVNRLHSMTPKHRAFRLRSQSKAWNEANLNKRKEKMKSLVK